MSDIKRVNGRFAPGHSGNPAGRPKGSRNVLTETFVAALEKDFRKHGAAAIRRCRNTDPGKYLQIISKLVPQHAELDVTVTSYETMTDAQLEEKLREHLASARVIDVTPAASRVVDDLDAPIPD